MCHATGACPAGKSAWWSLLQSPVGGSAGVARKHRRGASAGVEAVNETEALQAPGLSASAQASSTGSTPCSGLAHKTWMSGWAHPDERSVVFPGRPVQVGGRCLESGPVQERGGVHGVCVGVRTKEAGGRYDGGEACQSQKGIDQ